MTVIKIYNQPFGPALYGAWLWIKSTPGMIMPVTEREWRNAAEAYTEYASLNN